MEKIIFQAYPHFYQRMMQFVEQNQTIKNCDICFVGDSLIEMFDISMFEGICVNRGIISDKSAGVLMTLDDRVLALNPKKVFLFVGSNDICDGYSLKQIENNLKDIIRILKEKLNNVKIVVGTIMPPCYHFADHVDRIYPDCRDINRIEALNEIIKKLEGVAIFDAFSLMADKTKSLKVEDTLDGVHLTPNAYKKIAEGLKKVL